MKHLDELICLGIRTDNKSYFKVLHSIAQYNVVVSFKLKHELQFLTGRAM